MYLWCNTGISIFCVKEVSYTVCVIHVLRPEQIYKTCGALLFGLSVATWAEWVTRVRVGEWEPNWAAAVWVQVEGVRVWACDVNWTGNQGIKM